MTATGFAVNGALYGTLLSRYAEIAGHVGAGPAVFGAALAAGAVGGLAGSLLAPLAVRRLGDTAAVRATGCLYALLAVTVALAPGPVALGLALVAPASWTAATTSPRTR